MTDISALEAYAGQLSEAAALATASAQTQSEIVNGDASTDVLVESGPVPTLAKQALLAQAKVTASLEEVAAQMAGAMTYVSTAAGLLGTVSGGYFSVPSPDSKEYLILYKNTAGVAQEVSRYPSAQAIDELGIGIMDAEANDMTFAVGDQEGYSSWIQVDGRGLPTRYAAQCIGEQLLAEDAPALVAGAAIAAAVEVGFDTFDAEANDLSFSLSDSEKNRSDLELNRKGQFTDRVVASLALRMGVSQVAPPFPIDAWACWGDSLTAGGWPELLALLMGLPVYNGGWGGQSYSHIAARQGGLPARLTVTSNLIPASGPVTITAALNDPLSDGGARGGVLAGVTGLLSRAAGVLTFTRTTAGAAVACPAKSYFMPTDATFNADRHMTLWTGRNSFKDVAPARIVASIRAMIDFATPRVKRVIVMSIPPWVGEELGAANRIKLDACNAAIAAAFPGSWLDISAWLRTTEAATEAGITFTSDDLIDIANGLTPRSLRSDGGHPNALGNKAIAARVYQEIQLRGWV